MRYFRCGNDDLYESIRLQLDAAWGHPSEDGATITCFDPAAVAPRDSQGRIVLSVHDEFCQYSVVVDLLPALLASGAIDEIAREDYWAAIPQREL